MNLTLDLSPIVRITVTEFARLCRGNPDLRLELKSNGQVVLMPPAGGETGGRNARLITQLVLWADSNGGYAFDSDTGFRLSNGAIRAPDASWISAARWEALPARERETFPPLCPDLVVELRSPSDSMAELRCKMQEYLDCGARLGWLLDRADGAVEIYRPGCPTERIESPRSLSGESVLPGLALDLSRIL